MQYHEIYKFLIFSKKFVPEIYPCHHVSCVRYKYINTGPLHVVTISYRSLTK